jgi:SAM-dependent methyltransferase
MSRKRVELKQGRAEELPFADASFDKLISVHTLYFWPDLVAPLREAKRVLRPQGRIVLGYRADSAAARQFPRSVYCFRGEEELSQTLGTLGFEGVRTYTHQDGTAVVSMTIATRRP